MAISRVFQVLADARDDDGVYTRRVDVELKGDRTTLVTTTRLDAHVSEDAETLTLLSYEETFELAYTLLHAAGEISLDEMEQKLRELEQ